jgi:hypothetical protein
MENKSHQSGLVSWEVFNDLYENQYDLLRKIKFFVLAGHSEKNESLALEMVGELLANKQEELERLRQKGLSERDSLSHRKELHHFQLVPVVNPGDGNELMTPQENRSKKNVAVWSWVKTFFKESKQRA